MITGGLKPLCNCGIAFLLNQCKKKGEGGHADMREGDGIEREGERERREGKERGTEREREKLTVTCEPSITAKQFNNGNLKRLILSEQPERQGQGLAIHFNAFTCFCEWRIF